MRLFLPLSVLILSACASSTSNAPSAADQPPPEPKPQPGPRPLGHLGRGRSSPGQAQLDKAKKAAQDNDLDGALAAARQALATDAKLEDAYLLVGSICSMKRDAECSASTYDQGVSQLPDSAALLHARGMFELEGQKLAPALADLEKAHALTGGKDGEVDADLAYAYVFADRLDDAEKTASNAHALSPKAFAPSFVLGETLFRKERWKDAVAAYQDAVKNSPEDGLAQRRLAMALGKAEQHSEALQVYERLIKAAPDPGLHAARAGELIKLGRAKDAVQAMHDALKLAPNEPKLLELLLRAQDAAGDKDGAKSTRAKISAHGK